MKLKPNLIRPHSAQRGMSLLDVMLALTITAIATVVTVRDNLVLADSSSVDRVASDLTLIGESGKAFITANSGSSGILSTMGPNTLVLTIANLQAPTSCGTNACLTAAYLFTPPGQAAANQYLVRINRSGAPGAYTYTSAAYATKPWVTGGTTRLDLVGAAAKKVGGNALISYTTTTMDSMGGTGTGAATITNAGFPEITAVGQIGYMVSGGTPNINDAIYLRRDGLYAMTGNLQMGSNSVTGANAVNASSVTSTGAVNAGSVTTGGTVSANAVTATTSIGGATITASTSMSTGTLNASGNISTSGNVAVTGAGDVTIAGLSGTNKNVSSRLGQAAPMTSQTYTLSGASPTTSVTKPTCSAGGTPMIQLTNNSAAGGIYSARWGLQVQVANNAGSWTLSLTRATVPTATAPAPTDPDVVSGIAITYCAF